MLINADSMKKETFGRMEDNSIQAIITSPPYYLQRDYGHHEQIGLEADIDTYINNLVKVFSNCKDKLKDDGTLFINIADTYSGSNKGKGYVDIKRSKHNNTNIIYEASKKNTECRRKSLMAIPQRLAIAMIQSGWILRNQIIWNKPNAIPDSALDRFTTSYEVVLFFSKNEKYKFNTQYELAYTNDRSQPHGSKGVIGPLNGGRRKNDYDSSTPIGQRKKRDVMSINSEINKTNHFATFPKELVEVFILATSDIGDIIMDCFAGTGTTGIVSKSNGRSFIGVELVQTYYELANESVAKTPVKIPLF